jgi:predicted glycosyltransferase
MRVWIDLANSPHPLLFEPVARLLEELDHEVVVTARDHAQTVELAQGTWPTVEVIGGTSPRSRPGKVAMLADRVRLLGGFAHRNRPDVALSHNSYAQVVAARMLGIPAVTTMDYEHQPANHVAFRLASFILLPEALRGSEVATGQGASSSKTRYYPGLKEELYLGEFTPDPAVLDRLGVRQSDETAVVVARTAPSRAAYHRFDNALFEDVLRVLEAEANVACIVLPRNVEERKWLAALGSARLIVPEAAVDSRSLLAAADLVVGAGGTMTREAALLGAPTLTLFTGRPAAVDRWLEEYGLLRRLKRAQDVLPVARRPRGHGDGLARLRERGERLRAQLVDAVVETGRAGRRVSL